MLEQKVELKTHFSEEHIIIILSVSYFSLKTQGPSCKQVSDLAKKTGLSMGTIREYIKQKRENNLQIQKSRQCEIEFESFIDLLEHQSKLHTDDIPNFGQSLKEQDFIDAKKPKIVREEEMLEKKLNDIQAQIVALKLTEKQMDILDDWYKTNYGHVSQTFLSDSAANNLAKHSGVEKTKVQTYIRLSAIF